MLLMFCNLFFNCIVILSLNYFKQSEYFIYCERSKITSFRNLSFLIQRTLLKQKEAFHSFLMPHLKSDIHSVGENTIHKVKERPYHEGDCACNPSNSPAG